MSPDLCTWAWYSRENFVLKFQYYLFTTWPEGHNNYLCYIVLLQTVLVFSFYFRHSIFSKNMFQILLVPYKHPDEVVEWIVAVIWYFWHVMLHHWVIRFWCSDAAKFPHLQSLIGPGRILQGPVNPWRLGNFVASKCQDVIALWCGIIYHKSGSLCCATKTSELAYVVVENCFSDRLWTIFSWWDVSMLPLHNDIPKHVAFLCLRWQSENFW